MGDARRDGCWWGWGVGGDGSKGGGVKRTENHGCVYICRYDLLREVIALE